MQNTYAGEVASLNFFYANPTTIAELLANLEVVETKPSPSHQWREFSFKTKGNEWFDITVLDDNSTKLRLKFAPEYRGFDYTLSILFDEHGHPRKYCTVSPYGKRFSAKTLADAEYCTRSGSRWGFDIRKALGLIAIQQTDKPRV